ncbi:MAG: elongation factor P maturation arginine rhamnosyltransferase EarP [Candidatus Accumulibacter sp.]|nr:elongation factor P maturation arginine rhamnosyltransferase EarP [Accumulibacter sp.]
MNAPPLCWDIFCAVVDNYGDVGVAWRLARQLKREYGGYGGYNFTVRLWVDDLVAFRAICPEVSPSLSVQYVFNVEVRAWSKNAADLTPAVPPANVVVETFGTRAPDSYSRAMASASPRAVWINLEYLSAERWVEDCHTLPSPHPHLPRVTYFFFPGFTDKTGGLLRERDLEEDLRRFPDSPEAREAFWKTLGLAAPVPETQTLFLFAYENAATPGLLDFLASGSLPFRCIAPPCTQMKTFFGNAALSEKTSSRGRLEFLTLPAFVPQTRFDALLLCSDIVFVRGEDSFVRAQWVEKPFIWNVYPQKDKAHFAKLDAFLDLYCKNLSREASKAVRAFHHEWNENRFSPETCAEWIACLPELREHAKNWAKHLKKHDDLCRSLVKFCLSKL